MRASGSEHQIRGVWRGIHVSRQDVKQLGIQRSLEVNTRVLPSVHRTARSTVVCIRTWFGNCSQRLKAVVTNVIWAQSAYAQESVVIVCQNAKTKVSRCSESIKYNFKVKVLLKVRVSKSNCRAKVPCCHALNQVVMGTSFWLKCQKLMCHDFSALADWSSR